MPGLVGLGSKYFEKGLRVLFFPCNQAQSSSSLPTTTVATPRPPRAHPTHRGLPTAASPCPPQFASEEPGTAADIKAFYVDAHKLPAASLMERVDVDGANTHEVYKFLKGTPELGEKIEWNFTKFVVGRDGQVLGRYPQRTKPKDFDKMFAEMFAQAES